MIAAEYGMGTADWWAEFVTDFEDANPNVDLTVDVVSWNDIYTVVDTRIANGEAPDILNIDAFEEFQADGLLLPVEDYMSTKTYNKFYPAFMKESVINGTVWAVPDLASARALYYNADILEAAGVEVPTNWADLEAACKAIKAYDPSIYPMGIDATTNDGLATFALFSMGNSGGFTDAKGNPKLNSAANVEAVEFLAGLYNAGLTNEDPMNEDRYILQDMFFNGEVAMFCSVYGISPWGDSSVNYGVAEIPANTGASSASLGVMDRMMCFDNDYTDEELEAITAFFDFFYEDERYTEWTSMEGFLPATSTGSAFMASKDTSFRVWADALAAARFYPIGENWWYDARMAVIDVMQKALLGGDVQALLNQIQAEIAG